MSYPPQPPHGQPGPPSDPWQHTPPPTGYGLPGRPVPPPKKRNNTPLIIGLVAAAVVLVIGCCGVIAAIGAQEDDTPTAAASSPERVVEQTSPAVVVTSAPVAKPTTKPPATTAPVAKTVAMPKVTGKNAAVADDELRKLGFTNIRYGSQDQDDKVVLLLSNWTVTKQSAKAGAKTKTDTLIVLTCTKEG